MTTLNVTRGPRRGQYLLGDQGGNELGSLHAGWTVRRGEIRTDAGTSAVRRDGGHRVTAGDPDSPHVLLDQDRVVVPGKRPGGRWAITRYWGTYVGTLNHGSQAMVLRLAALRGRHYEVEVTAGWEQRDLIVLTACFALLARRRHDFTIAMAASGSHRS